MAKKQKQAKPERAKTLQCSFVDEDGVRCTEMLYDNRHQGIHNRHAHGIKSERNGKAHSVLPVGRPPSDKTRGDNIAKALVSHWRKTQKENDKLKSLVAKQDQHSTSLAQALAEAQREIKVQDKEIVRLKMKLQSHDERAEKLKHEIRTPDLFKLLDTEEQALLHQHVNG